MQQTTGINPRVEAFWMRSGMQPDMRMVRKRRKLFEYKKKKRYPKDMLDEEEGKLWKEYVNEGQKNTKYLNGITLQKQLAIPILINMEPMSPERGLDLLFLSSILHMSILS